MVLKTPPIDVLLANPRPNAHPVTRGHEVYIITPIFLGLATILVFFRLYARIFIRRWFGLDDAFMSLAWLCTVGVATTVLLGVKNFGWDRHVYDLTSERYAFSGKILFISCLFWSTSSSFVRLSLLCFYYRLTEHVHVRSYRWVLHILFSISVAFLIAYIFALTFMCIPVSAFWTYPDNLSAKCIDVGRFMLIMSIINTLLELITALLPIPVVFHLQMEARHRFNVISLLSLGVLVFLVGCVRCFFVYKALLETWDTTWWSQPHWTASEVENNLALICACAPALRPVFGRLLSSRQLRPPPKQPPSETMNTTTTRSFGSLHPREKAQLSAQSTTFWFDLEGIADDGLGYTVSITTGKPPDRKGRGRRRTGGSVKRSPSKLVKRMSVSGEPPKAQPEAEQRIEIVTRRSVEIRESFHDNNASEEIYVWKSMSEKDSDLNDDMNAGTNYSRPTRTQSRERRVSALAPSESNNAPPQRTSYGPGGTTTGRTTTPSPLPEVHHTPRQSADQPQWLTPPRPASRGPVNPLNSSQLWATPRPHPSRLSDPMDAESNYWTLHMATMRDVYRWQRNDGSMYPEDGSRPDSHVSDSAQRD